MAPQHWQQVKEILGEALERDEGEPRTTFVAERCGKDTSLRDEVDAYLNVSGQKVEACAENIRHVVLDKIQSEQIGRRLGAYRIVKEIGRGGMGAVFLAERADGQFEKQVAIKLLKRGTDTDEIVRRFRAERQILAQLEHYSIARLLDAGTTEDGLPYFVMEYVLGVPITTFVRERQLLLPQRLELFLKVCAAVERAHRDNIVHRDLKPSNILVTSEGEPKLLDFGIAKLLEPDENQLDATATNQQRFTPTCVSPEQARGETITIASDIYALGALLYEILTDRTPYQFSNTRPSPEEVARVVGEQEPLRPSLTVSDGGRETDLEGDLDNIVLCALRKEPECRYPSVAEFAEDIKRHLAARPVQARPITTLYRARMFLTRNRLVGLPLVLTALVFVVVGLLAVSPRLRSFSRLISSPNNEAGPQINDKSIAVLPFDSFNGEKDNNYFVDGVQDDILTDLARISDLKVMSRGAVASYRGANKNAQEIGRTLGVAHVLEGSVQKSGNRVRVNARLVDTRTNTQIWADHYDRSVDDLFGLQSELAQTIVAQLKVTLTAQQKAAIEAQPTQDMQAYDLYLKARDLLSRPPEKEGRQWKKADGFVEAAIARDPKFTLAYCLKSEIEILLYRYFDHTPGRLAAAKEAATRASQLAPNLGEPHLALAQYYYHGFRDYARVQGELNLAAATMSGKAEFLSIAEVNERRLGHWKDALRDGEKAMALDPHDPVYATTLMESYLVLRMFSEAERVADVAIAQLPGDSAGLVWADKADAAIGAGKLDHAQEIIEAAPKNLPWKNSMLSMVAFCKRDYARAAQLLEKTELRQSKGYWDYLLEGKIRRKLEEPEKSRAAFEQAKNLIEDQLRSRPDDSTLVGFLAVSYAGLGRKDDAIATARKATLLLPLSQDPIDGPNCVAMLAEVYATTGEPEAALNALSKIVRLPSGVPPGELRFNPVWDALRNNARFSELLIQVEKPLDFS